MVKDPVCGMEIDEKKSINHNHKGKEYHFCNPTCEWAFKSNPDQFVKKEED